MKTILIIYPHFPPSNLAGVHRARLFAQHLPSFGWDPIILTVDEKFYEESLDQNLLKLLPDDLRIEKVKAFKITKPRLIGDVGLRGFFQLYKRAKQIIRSEKINFIFIPIPSFYCALIGRMLYRKTNVPYGIDYIDPWVHQFPGSEKQFSRHWFSTKLAAILEKIAIKKAALITGVAAGYYEPAIERNEKLKKRVITGAMPYGGERMDHEMMQTIGLAPYLFKKVEGKFKIVYAGAMMPKSYSLLEAIFSAIAQAKGSFVKTEFHFIGTGSSPDDSEGFNVKPLAEKYNLWRTVVFEYPRRIPYLDVLAHLAEADGIFILGSTEPHYTPSKSYQGVLSGKPIMAVLHKESSAVNVLRLSGAGVVLDFNGEKDITFVEGEFCSFFMSFISFMQNFDPNLIDQEYFEKYSAKAVTSELATLLDKAVINTTS